MLHLLRGLKDAESEYEEYVIIAFELSMTFGRFATKFGLFL